MLHYSSVFSTNTQKNKSLVGKCIYTDGHREDFLFVLFGHKCIRGQITDAFHSCGKLRTVEKRLMFTFTSVRDFFSVFLRWTLFVSNILGKFCFRSRKKGAFTLSSLKISVVWKCSMI